MQLKSNSTNDVVRGRQSCELQQQRRKESDWRIMQHEWYLCRRLIIGHRTLWGAVEAFLTQKETPNTVSQRKMGTKGKVSK